MAMLKHVKESENNKNIIFIPGGPGLGPISFNLLTEFIDDANVYHYFPSGCDGNEILDQDYSYASQLNELKSELEVIDNPIIVGHSFGGVLASDLVIQAPNLVKALICIAAPFSEEVFIAASETFNEVQSSESDLVNTKFKNAPTNQNYKEWFSFYGELYFIRENVNTGKEMILADSACAQSYIAARGESAKKEFLLEKLNQSPIKKLFILGKEDKILPFNLLQEDALAGDFKIETIKNAGHFVHYDQPKLVADVINKFINEMGE